MRLSKAKKNLCQTKEIFLSIRLSCKKPGRVILLKKPSGNEICLTMRKSKNLQTGEVKTATTRFVKVGEKIYQRGQVECGF